MIDDTPGPKEKTTMAPRNGRRMQCAAVATLLATTLTMVAPALAAVTPEQRCEGGKNDAAGKYASCMAKAQKSYVATGDGLKYGAATAKCMDKYGTTWGKLEQKAVDAGTTCPSTGDQTAIQDFLDACAASVATAVGGGPLPLNVVDCNADLGTCVGDLSSTNADLTSCEGDLSSTNADLTTCEGDLSTTNADLTTCEGDLSSTNADLTTCEGDLSSTNADLTSCEGDLSSTNADLTTCEGDLSTTNADLTTCEGDLAACEASSGGVPKTGQTTSYGAGSDGDLERGTARSFTDNGDGTITDNGTGLMWEKKSDDGSIHDKDNTYTWGMVTAPYTMNGTMVTTFLADLNSGGGFAGYTDWRIPNISELQTLVNFQIPYPGPAVFPAFNASCIGGCTVTTCSCTRSGTHWSSSTYRDGENSAWYVYFGDGHTLRAYKTDGGFVRAVRSGS